MANLNRKILVILLMFSVISCEKADFKGLFKAYSDVNERFEQSMEWNNTHPQAIINVPGNVYEINAMGDSHVGGTKNLDILIEESIRDNVAASVFVGDLTTGHKKDYDTFAAHLPRPDSLTYFAIAGNHDLYFDGWQYFYGIFGSSTYYFVVNTPDTADLFICLDSGGGTLGNKQLDWFKNVLQNEREKHRYCVVSTHVNLFRMRPTTSTNPFVEEVQVLTDLFLRYNVNMVVTGHDHKRNTDILGNTTHIIMDDLQDISNHASYLKLSIDNENISYKFIDI